MRKTKVPKIKIEVDDDWLDAGQDTSMFFAWRYANGEIGDSHSCRECFIGDMAGAYLGQPYSPSLFQFNTNKTEVVVHQHISWLKSLLSKEADAGEKMAKEAHLAMFRGLRLIHHFEKLASWPRTKLYEVEAEEAEEEDIIYLFSGDKRWQRTPYTISLYTLLIRLGRWKEFENVKSHIDFTRACEKIYKLHGKVPFEKIYSLENKEYDIEYLDSNFRKRVGLLMKNFEKIFQKVPAKTYFTKFDCEEFEFDGEGITDFCGMYAGYDNLRKRFQVLCREKRK